MILFITRKYPPSVGGMEQLSYRMITGVASLTETQVIACRWTKHSGHLLFVPLAFVGAFWILLRRRREVTALHVGDGALAPLGLALKAIFNVPTAVTLHGLDVVFPNTLYQWVVPFCLRKLDRVVCISSYAKDEAMRRGIKPERCHVIPVGIDALELSPEISRIDARSSLSSLIGCDIESPKLLLTVGRLVRRKGVAEFIGQALPLLLEKQSGVHYLVVGKGPQREAIEQEIAARGLQGVVTLLGEVDKATLELVYRAADLFIMPNIPVAGDGEGFGLVALEASLAGLPVVAADIEGIRDAVTAGKNGILVPAEDWQTFAVAISELLADDISRSALGESGRTFVVENFNWEAIALRYLEVFNGMARRSVRKEDDELPRVGRGLR